MLRRGPVLGRLAAAVLALILTASVLPAQAQAPAVRRLLRGNPCAAVTLKLDFAANSGSGLYCLKGTRYGRFLDIPGASFARASNETCEWLSGRLTYAALGVPCITDKGFGGWAASSNIALWSQVFSNAVWVGSNANVTDNAATAPDGTATAAAILAGGTGSVDHVTTQTIAVSATSAWAESFYVKPGAVNWVAAIVFNQASVGVRRYFQLTGAGVVGSAEDFNGGTEAGWSIQPAANGFYRVSVVQSSIAATSVGVRIEPANADLGRIYAASDTTTPQLYVWGAELDQGSALEPYTPTTSASATHAADAASITGLTVAPGTLFVQGVASTTVPTTNQYLAALSDGSSNNRLSMFRPTGTNLSSRDVAGGVNASPPDISGAIPGGPFKAALAFSASRAISAAGGSLSVASAPSAIPAYTTLSIGVSENAASAWLNGFVQRVLIYPSPLPDAQLQALTQ